MFSVFEYCNVPVDDTTDADLLAHLPATDAFLRGSSRSDSAGAVLCHCTAGVSRAASVLIGHWISRDGLEMYEAMQRLRAHRTSARVAPNIGFFAQLTELVARQRAGGGGGTRGGNSLQGTISLEDYRIWYLWQTLANQFEGLPTNQWGGTEALPLPPAGDSLYLLVRKKMVQYHHDVKRARRDCVQELIASG